MSVEKCCDLLRKSIKLGDEEEARFMEALVDPASKDGRERVIKLDFLQRFCDFFVFAPFMVRPEKNKSSVEIVTTFNTLEVTDIRDSLSQARKDLVSQLMEIFWKRIEQRFSSLQKAFRFFDYSQDNCVVFQEFKNACNTIGLRFSIEEQEMIFNKFDSDKEGYFTYAQFVKLNGDKRSTYLNSYQPGKRILRGNHGQSLGAVIRPELGFTLDTTGQQITETFIRRRG